MVIVIVMVMPVVMGMPACGDGDDGDDVDDGDDGVDGYDVYEAYSCPSFWIRHSIDGSSELFFELLETTIKTFDSDFAIV